MDVGTSAPVRLGMQSTRMAGYLKRKRPSGLLKVLSVWACKPNDSPQKQNARRLFILSNTSLNYSRNTAGKLGVVEDEQNGIECLRSERRNQAITPISLPTVATDVMDLGFPDAERSLERERD